MNYAFGGSVSKCIISEFTGEVLSKYVGWGSLSDAFDESKSAWSSEC